MKKRYIVFVAICLLIGGYIYLLYSAIPKQEHLTGSGKLLLLDRNGERLYELRPLYSSQRASLSPLHMKWIHLLKSDGDFSSYFNRSHYSWVKQQAFLQGIHIPFFNKAFYEGYYQQAYFGYGVFGLEKASRQFFGKSFSKLTNVEQLSLFVIEDLLSEDPFVTRKSIIQRMKNVRADADITLNDLNRLTFRAIPKDGRELARTVIYQLYGDNGIAEIEYYTKSSTIRTTIDHKIQQQVEKTVSSMDIPAGANVALVISNMDGDVISFMNGKTVRYFDPLRSIQLKKSPASTFKPIAVYAPAIEKGWKKSDMLIDKNISFNGYRPTNYDFKYRGKVSLSEALAHSYNVPAVWLLDHIGISTGVQYAKRFGFHVSEGEGYKIALGSLAKGVSPSDMVSAYRVFANKGAFKRVSFVKSVDMGGKVYRLSYQDKQIIKESTAETMKQLLHQVTTDGTAANLKLPGYWSGKTGTASNFFRPNLNEHAWFVGFNDQYISAVWIGYDDPPLKGGLDTNGGGLPVQLFHDVFTEIYYAK